MDSTGYASFYDKLKSTSMVSKVSGFSVDTLNHSYKYEELVPYPKNGEIKDRNGMVS